MTIKQAILASMIGAATVHGSDIPNTGLKARLDRPAVQTVTANPLAFFNDGLSHWKERVEIRPNAFRNTHLPEITPNALKGLNINAVQNEFGQTLVTAAAMNFQADLIRELKKMGADMNQPTPTMFPHTPLELLAMVAPENNEQRVARCDALRALVESGADINAVDENGDTFLMNVSRQQDLPLMKLAKELGADVSLRNKEGKTADEIYQSVVLPLAKFTKGRTVGD